MEEYSKLWENEVFMTWKAGSPGVDVGLAMNFICTCCTEYNAQRMILVISDATIIRYPVAQVDEEDAGNSTGEIPDDDDDDTATMMWMRIFSKWPQKSAQSWTTPAFMVVGSGVSGLMHSQVLELNGWGRCPPIR